MDPLTHTTDSPDVRYGVTLIAQAPSPAAVAAAARPALRLLLLSAAFVLEGHAVPPAKQAALHRQLLDVADALDQDTDGPARLAFLPAPLSPAEQLNVAQWQREATAQLRDQDAGVPTHRSKVIVDLCRLVRQLTGEGFRA